MWNTAELAGIRVEGENKWLTIIQNASTTKMTTRKRNVLTSDRL
jgi:hypothetical protein